MPNIEQFGSIKNQKIMFDVKNHTSHIALESKFYIEIPFGMKEICINTSDKMQARTIRSGHWCWWNDIIGDLAPVWLFRSVKFQSNTSLGGATIFQILFTFILEYHKASIYCIEWHNIWSTHVNGEYNALKYDR